MSVSIPRIQAGGRDIVVTGRAIRTARIDGDSYRFVDDPESLMTDLRNRRDRIDLFTFMQRLTETEPRYSYPMEWDNYAVVEIKNFDEWWMKQINNKTRNMVRQAEKKGVVVCEVPFDDSLVQGIWNIYNECPIRQGRKFFNYGKTVDTIRREAATFLDCSVFIGAFLHDELIGFVKFTIDENGTQAGLMHILSMLRHRDKAVTNALVAQTVRACSDRGIPRLVYSHFAYGNKSRDSLSDFKEHNGFRRVDVPRYYVPLNRFGHVALRLGFHRSIHDHLPESVIAAFRRYRALWYQRKYGPPTSGPADSRTVTGA
jgi:hypothetical protein